MIIVLDRTGKATVSQPDDFKRFSVEVDAPQAQFERIAQASKPFVAFDDTATAWVDIASLRATGVFDAEDRAAGFEKMLAAAAPHGWVSADGRAIKSHVGWKA